MTLRNPTEVSWPDRLRLWAEVFTLSYRTAPARSTVIGIMVLLQGACLAVVALGQRYVVDIAAVGSWTWAVLAAALGVAVAHGIDSAGNRVHMNLRNDVAELVDIRLNRDVLGWNATLPQLDHQDRPEFGERLHIVRRGTNDLAASGWVVVQYVVSVISLLVSLVLLVQVSPWLAGVAALSVAPLLLGGTSQRAARRARDVAAPLERQEERLHRLVTEPEPAKEVRISRNTADLDTRADELWQQVTQLTVRGQLAAASLQLLGWAIYALGYAGALAVTAWLATRGEATVGDLVLVSTLAMRLRWQINSTVFGFNALADGARIARNFLWLRRTHAAAPRGTGTVTAPLTEGIRFEDVSFRYPGAAADTLQDVSFHLPAGGTVALLGENGAGKTTLVKLLLGLYRPTAGRITIDGVDLSDLDPDRWREHCTGLQQDFAKLQGQVGASVRAGAIGGADHSAQRAALETAHATEIVADLPAGDRTELGLAFGGREVSHGQAQRLALARGMMRAAPLVLILDEPTSALDPLVEHQLFDTFFSRAADTADTQGTIAVVVSHRMSTTRGVDRIIVLDHGRVVETGSHAELSERGGAYAELHDLQRQSYR